MAEMVRSGVIDCIGSARGSIADPFLPRKIEEGRLDDIRECIGNNVCAARYMQRGLLDLHPERDRRRGVPPRLAPGEVHAGRERGSRRARRRRRAGRDGVRDGARQARHAPRPPRRRRATSSAGSCAGSRGSPGLGEWGRVVNYRRIQLEQAPERRAASSGRGSTPSAVLGYGADIVVVATGARWAADGLNGATHAPIPGADASLPHVLTPEQMMVEGKEVPGERVLVYDSDGYYMGVGLAEKLAREGKQVTFVTPFALDLARTRRSRSRRRGSTGCSTRSASSCSPSTWSSGSSPAACTAATSTRPTGRSRGRPTRSCWSRSASRTTRSTATLSARPRRLPDAGIRGALPDRRLRRAPPRRRRDLRRPPACPRDRLGRPGDAAPVHPREPRPRRDGRRLRRNAPDAAVPRLPAELGAPRLTTRFALSIRGRIAWLDTGGAFAKSAAACRDGRLRHRGLAPHPRAWAG